MIRKQINFYGRVQSVGFRYRAYYAANRLGLTGWVKNERDGSVTMEVQGTQEQIDQMISMIQEGTFINIEDMEVRKLPLKEDERGFRVTGY